MMELDKTCKDRDYLFGRLWAVAEMGCNEEYENAGSLQSVYADFKNYPCETWMKIVTNPKYRFLMSGKYGQNISDIIDLFDHDDYVKKEKLGNLFMAGYTCQKIEGIKNIAAAELGRRGGLVKSEAKAAAARENGRKGRRPRKQPEQK
jgi:CRISPR-associated protein Csd1